MKQALLCTVLLFFLACGSLVAAHEAVSDTDDQVSLIETDHIGDPQAAQQLRLGVTCTHQNHLRWNFSVIPGQTPETEFQFSSKKFPRPKDDRRFQGLWIDSPFGSGMRSPDGGLDFSHEPLPEFVDILEEVSSRTAPGTTHAESLSVADYFSAYPLNLSVDREEYLPHDYLRLQLEAYRQGAEERQYALAHPDEYSASDIAYYRQMEAEMADLQQQLQFYEDLQRLFSFPVPENAAVTVTISKNSSGEVCEYYSNDGATYSSPVDVPYGSELPAPTVSDNPMTYLQVPQIQSGDFLYFVPDFLIGEERMDYSRTPGYGLYRLDLSQEELSIEDLRLVLPLEEAASPSDLILDASGTRVLLSTVAENQATLYIIDAADSTLVQTISTGTHDLNENHWISCITKRDLLLVIQSWKTFRLFQQQPDGLYQEQFSGELPDEERFPILLRDLYDMAYDGKTLAILSGSSRYSSPGQNPGFNLALWDRSGLVYAGIYNTSLEAGQPEYYTPGSLVYDALTLDFSAPTKE